MSHDGCRVCIRVSRCGSLRSAGVSGCGCVCGRVRGRCACSGGSMSGAMHRTLERGWGRSGHGWIPGEVAPSSRREESGRLERRWRGDWSDGSWRGKGCG
jgi:hypothetical protein